MNIFGKNSYSLPSEAQWEYAARSGTKTSRYWGDSLEDACAYGNMADPSYVKVWPDNATSLIAAKCDDGYARTAPVGTYRPNAFGLYDMLGNVFSVGRVLLPPQLCRSTGRRVRLPGTSVVYAGRPRRILDIRSKIRSVRPTGHLRRGLSGLHRVPGCQKRQMKSTIVAET
jgi:hypothetical protein